MKRLTDVNAQLQKGLAAAELIFATIDEVPEQDTGSLVLPQATGQMSFNNVTLQYANTLQPALDAISLDIQPGEKIALVGLSGSGKTSLANLLPRFYAPDQGQITLDGHPLEAITLASLRHNMSYVSQEIVLFNDTLAANIAYGLCNQQGELVVTEAQIIAAAQAAHAWEFICRLPQGLQTNVGDRGVRLSGGQRQRIAIARALLKNAPILILDEATSALDSESERYVQLGLQSLMAGRTTLMIAHRLSTIEQVDRIIVMDAGRIIEMGTHAELLAHQGQYAKLYALQFSRS
jgi:subfamily B ATP-binding cassette protein MsbA